LIWKAIPYVPLLQSGGNLNSGAVEIDGIPYSPKEVISSGVVLWDRTPDT
jgi:hypothetical protein